MKFDSERRSAAAASRSPDAVEQVGLGHAVVAQRDLREVLDEAREHVVAVLRVAEPSLVVVVDPGEDALQRGVLLFEGRAGLVQRLADVGGRLQDGALPRPVGHEELVLVGVGPRHVLGAADDGSLLGVLPAQRRFEFRNEDTGRVVSGRIDPALEDAGTINEVLNRPTRITVVARRVGSAGSRYVLLAYELAGD